MLGLKTKKELSVEAFKLAAGSELVRYQNLTYVPADYETGATDVVPDPDRTIWLPLSRALIRDMAAEQFDTLFGSDSELASFEFMVAQSARQVRHAAHALLVRSDRGLLRLGPDGQFTEAPGNFIPNTLKPMLNEDPAAKQKVFDVIQAWLNSEEEAKALLSHLATSLAPGWSAIKYVILIGEGRNGKSVLLKMLQKLFGNENVSHVTRQDMAEGTTAVMELNGKLLNIVFDGQAQYLKDSGREKSLIAGEPVPIKKLYESAPVMVQTNSLFIEGLNREPKSGDKSTALQKRLVRFQFPNVYPDDHKFEREMLKEETLGAFLALLVDYYVQEDEVAQALAPTTRALELQLEHMYVNSVSLQFLKHLEDTDPLGATKLLGEELTVLVSEFQSWRLRENDLGSWAEPDVQALFIPLVNTERQSKRVDGKPRKVRVVTSFKSEAAAFIATLKEEEDDVEALVAE